MRLFGRKKPKQKVGSKDVTVDEKLVASIREAMQPKRRKRFLFVDAKAELRRIAKEEAERKK